MTVNLERDQQHVRITNSLLATTNGTSVHTVDYFLNELANEADSTEDQFRLFENALNSIEGTNVLTSDNEIAESIRTGLLEKRLDEYDSEYGAEVKKVYLTGIAEEEAIGNTQANGGSAAGVVGTVPFDVQPTISESGTTLYTEINDIRQAGSIMIFMGSPGRDITINAQFISRTKQEADMNRKYVQILRSWRMPEKEAGVDSVRSPSRLRLKGYGRWMGATTSITRGIPVRMTSLTIDMPDDTDYILTDSNYFIPIVWKISMSLKETRSIDELFKFNIKDFRKGTLDGW